MPWIRDPHSGGTKIPKSVQEATKQRILAYAEKHYSGRYIRLDIRFRNQFCYIDAFVEPNIPPDFPPADSPQSREEYIERVRNTPLHLCRLRYFGSLDSWSLAFYTYSSEKYQPCVFDNGDWYGSPEEGFKIGAVYL